MSEPRNKWTFTYRISGPTQDPFLLIDFLNRSMALLFDCGVRVWGHVKTILKIQHLFITHAHIDHLIGFDHILRAILGEDKVFSVYGPPGIAARISSKLQSYDWDRASDQGLVLYVHEVLPGKTVIRKYECRKQFIESERVTQSREDNIVLHDEDFVVRAEQVFHGGSPCMAYSFEERDYFRIDKEKMATLGLIPGPWVGKFLDAVVRDAPGEITIDTQDGKQRVAIRQLRHQIIRKQHGRKITYITDTVFAENTLRKVLPLAMNSDILFCESTFLDKDSDLARQYHHLTAKQAAIIARESRVKRLVLFHVSSRYLPNIDQVLKEARDVFPGTELAANSVKRRKPAGNITPDKR